RLRFQEMAAKTPSSKLPISQNPEVIKFQQVFRSETNGYWDRCWEEGLTPWDLGSPTPLLLQLHNTGSLPTGRALVPGCGSGYDVEAIACPERHAIGLEISDSAIKKAKELHSLSRHAAHFDFIKADFFSWSPTELFDLIFDYTFFCAIRPESRSLWGVKMSELLKPGGELITLIYPIDEHEGGPPYKVSVADYEEVLHPVGFQARFIGDNHSAVSPR
ncbi:hypothetical protein M569_10868, partial [Genlisea aurea]